MKAMVRLSVLGLLAAIACGCADQEPPGAAKFRESCPAPGWRARPGGGTNKAGPAMPAAAENSSLPSEAAVVPEGGPRAHGPLSPDTGISPAPVAMAPAPAAADAMVATARPHPGRSREDRVQQTGLLTAGSFDDNLNPAFFRSFLGRLSQRREFGGLPGRLTGQRLLVSVRDGVGNPVGGARVTLAAPGGARAGQLLTRTDGRAVFLSSWDAFPTDGDLTVTVEPPDGSAPVTQRVPRGSESWEVRLPQAHGERPRDLDLAIVLDTTGSMGNELEYLKAEIKGIATAVRQKFPHVNQHYGLIVYRDVGDEYVTRRFDFTPSVDEFRANLSAQSASGGGDYPESMQRGLEEAVQLRWREGPAARVMFLIADAPPHNQHLGQALAAADRLRKKGVAIYPVACSGYDDACELVMRGCALEIPLCHPGGISSRGRGWSS